ncbi:MAG: C40 family peptidase [bacterium]|nr:C40 family peptidase [bacterium]
MISMTTDQQRKIVSIARSFIGVPYKYGATPEEAPRTFDCSSFTQYCMKQVGINIPRSSILQGADAGGVEIELAQNYSNLEPGDLVFFRGQRGYYHDSLFPGRELTYIGHVGIYAGNGNIVHCHHIHKDSGVHEESIERLSRDPRYCPALVRRF